MITFHWIVLLLVLALAYLVGVGVGASRLEEPWRGCYRGGEDDCSDEPPKEGSGQ